MERISKRDLDAVCRRINRTVNGTDETPAWSPAAVDDPRNETTIRGYYANVDVFVLDGAYGGWALHRIVSDGGAVTDVFGSGHMPKRELYDRMQAFLRGIEVAA